MPCDRRLESFVPLFVAAAVSAVMTPLAGSDPDMHDDGVVKPYVPPKEQLDYVAHLDPGLVPTLKADPAMIKQWQDDQFGVFMHWDPSCQVTGAISWARNGRRPHHSSDGTVTKEGN